MSTTNTGTGHTTNNIEDKQLIACSHISLNKYDPTHTLTLRNKFAKEMNKRFSNVRRSIVQAVDKDDCFGFRNELVSMARSPGKRSYSFLRSPDKVVAFMDWLKEMVDEEVLSIHLWEQVGIAANTAWTNMYIESAYRRGIRRGRMALHQAGYVVVGGITSTALENAFQSAFHADRIGLLYTRVFNDLKGITDQMDSHISRLLAQGIAEGRNPKEIASMLISTIENIGEDLGITDTLGRFIPAGRRAEILARTEIIRAHHQAMVQEYRNWGAEGVFIKAEWKTAGDNRVCEECASLEGRVYTLDEVENMIPEHPNCRCVALPVDITDEVRERMSEEEVDYEWE